MAFWDEIREKITQGSQEALQKTKDIADVVTINAETPPTLGGSYSSIRYNFEVSCTIYVPCGTLEAYKTFIKSEKEVIELGESRINELRSETRCPGCGSKVVKGMSFCPECGRKLMKPAPAKEAVAGEVKPKAQEPQAAEAQDTETAKAQDTES